MSFVFKTNQLTGIIMYNNENVSLLLSDRVITKPGRQRHLELDWLHDSLYSLNVF